jgi:hypothetical protein
MTNQDDLPIWARILLGVPVRDDRQTDHATAKGQQNVGPTDHDDEQSVLTFDLAASKRKRGWHALICPVPGKLRS